MSYWVRFVIRLLGGLILALGWAFFGVQTGIFPQGQDSAVYGWGLFAFFLLGSWLANKGLDRVASRKDRM